MTERDKAGRAIHAVAFDKDGTLFEFEETWRAFCDQMLDHIAGEDAALRAKLAHFCGYDTRTRRFVPGSLIVGGSIEQLCAGWAEMIPHTSPAALSRHAARVIADLNPAPLCDLQSLVGALHETGHSLGLITNDLESAARAQLSAQNVEGSFCFICGSDSGYRAKPDPDALLAFCESASVLPAQMAMIGDSLHDLQAARAAGAGLVIAVLSGPADRAELAPHADWVLASVAELPNAMAALPRHRR